MSRIPLSRPETATGDLQASFATVKKAFGKVPHGIQALGASPNVLRGYLAFSTSLAEGGLSKRDRERIALLTAQRNECGYCLAAHTAAGRAAGLSDAELTASRHGKAEEQSAAAVLRMAEAVIKRRGEVSDGELAAAREAGLTDANLLEIVAEVALNTFTNYYNRLVRTELDFPEAPAHLPAQTPEPTDS